MKVKKRFKFIAIPIFVVGVLFALSFIVMQLWNYSIVKAANLNVIDFWQAMALLILSKILFGFGMGGRRKPWSARRKWHRDGPALTDEQKAAFKDKWNEHCNPESKNSD